MTGPRATGGLWSWGQESTPRPPAPAILGCLGLACQEWRVAGALLAEVRTASRVLHPTGVDGEILRTNSLKANWTILLGSQDGGLSAW